MKTSGQEHIEFMASHNPLSSEAQLAVVFFGTRWNQATSTAPQNRVLKRLQKVDQVSFFLLV